MPGGDRTGPMGMGPMTGGGRGFCGTANSPRRFLGLGRGLGRGNGGGRGWRCNPFYRTGFARSQAFQPAAQVFGRQEEANLLKDQAEAMTQQLEDIRKRISELESTKDR